MSFEYVSVEEAMARRGLRMVVVGRVPSPWGEAAKSFFHIKKLDWAAVRLVYDDEALKRWAGQLSGPVVFYDDEPPRSGWAEILMLAERLAPEPALLPADPRLRSQALLLCEKFCGEGGLGWTRRLQQVHAGLNKAGGFSERVAAYLGNKYGYDPARAGDYGPRVRELLGEIAAALRAQRVLGKPYYLGDTLSAVDVYSATFTAMFKPLPEEVCTMDPKVRAAFSLQDEATAAAVDPVLIEHRDRLYATHLALPLCL
jgi:glutathione S-transferase